MASRGGRPAAAPTSRTCLMTSSPARSFCRPRVTHHLASSPFRLTLEPRRGLQMHVLSALRCTDAVKSSDKQASQQAQVCGIVRRTENQRQRPISVALPTCCCAECLCGGWQGGSNGGLLVAACTNQVRARRALCRQVTLKASFACDEAMMCYMGTVRPCLTRGL